MFISPQVESPPAAVAAFDPGDPTALPVYQFPKEMRDHLELTDTSPSFEELSAAESLKQMQDLYKEKYGVTFRSEQELLRRICTDWFDRSKDRFLATSTATPLSSPAPCLRVEINGIKFNLLGITHDAPHTMHVSQFKLKESTIVQITFERNKRFDDFRAQADLEAITDTLTLHPLVFSEDNMDQYLAECDYPEYGELLIPLNDHEIFFAASLPEATLSDSPYLAGLMRAFIFSSPFVQHAELSNCVEALDPADAEIEKFMAQEPSAELFKQFSPDQSQDQFCQIMNRIPEGMVYSYFNSEIADLPCAPPIGIVAELEQRGHLSIPSARLRSALMALTLLKIKLPQEIIKDNEVTVLTGRGHSAEIAYFIKHPPTDKNLELLAERAAAKITHFLTVKEGDLANSYDEERSRRMMEYMRGINLGVLLDLVIVASAASIALRVNSRRSKKGTATLAADSDTSSSVSE